jgi:hypothetical protein
MLLIALEKKNALDNRGTKLKAVGFDIWSADEPMVAG